MSTAVTIAIMLIAVLVWVGLVGLLLAVNHGGHSGTHPRPERPSVGDDVTHDDEEPPTTGI